MGQVMDDVVATLIAAIDRIIPADDFPSASGAGVHRFIIGLLQRERAGDAQTFAAELTTLNRAAKRRWSRPFAALPAADQDQLLRESEAGKVMSARFFRLLVDVTMEGYYADPGNLGNKDAVSWKMIGYERRIPGMAD